MMQAKERLYLTKDKKALVKEGDPRGASLYAARGDEIPDSAAALFGLVDGTVAEKKAKEPAPANEPAPAKTPKTPKAAKSKQAAPSRNKELAPVDDKGAAPQESAKPEGGAEPAGEAAKAAEDQA